MTTTTSTALALCLTYFFINFSRMPPVGSYTNIESRDSPLCSIADENETTKLTYKKSVFKKKSTSSTATVSAMGAKYEMIVFDNRPLPPLFFFFVVLVQLIVNVKVDDDSIRTTDLWCQKRPLYQLSHNHCTALVSMYKSHEKFFD